MTSSVRGEGKSTSSVNLSFTFAQTGKRVLLIDAVMRLPSIASKLDIHGAPGLSNLLAGLNSERHCIRKYGKSYGYGYGYESSGNSDTSRQKTQAFLDVTLENEGEFASGDASFLNSDDSAAAKQ